MDEILDELSVKVQRLKRLNALKVEAGRLPDSDAKTAILTELDTLREDSNGGAETEVIRPGQKIPVGMSFGDYHSRVILQTYSRFKAARTGREVKR